MGVSEWDDYMQGVHVLAWVQSEPRRRVPLDLIHRALLSIDRTVFWEVQAAVLLLMLLFTFARSETPCPKSYTGAGALDETKHLLVRDVKVKAQNGKSYIAIRLKSIKQDPLIERAKAAGGEDWIIVGDVADSPFSILAWIRILFSMHGGARDASSAFFLDRDRQRWLTYANAMRDVRTLWARVSSTEESELYGLHSLRVTGYNAAKQGKHGKELAVAQGGWSSSAHERYARWDIDDVMDLSSVIVSHQSTEGNSVAALQRPPLPTASHIDNTLPSPRPMPAHIGTGSRRGEKRKRSQEHVGTSSANTSDARVATDLVVGNRVDIYWTHERTWFPATITRQKDLGKPIFEVLYDEHEGFVTRRARPYMHDLSDERWRLLA